MLSMRGGKVSFERIFCGHSCWVLALFLTGLGAKFSLILKSGWPLPYYDQWEGEAADTYIPYFQHALTFVDLFRAHNEHRIFFTRIYDLILLLLNGQWDSQLQMTANAFLHCGAVAGFGWLMARLLGKKCWPLIFPPLVLLLVLPFGWENTLWGFQSAFYFLLIFSLLTMQWLGLSEPMSGRWKLGVVAGILALFTIASGFMAAAALAALCVVDILKDRQVWRRQMPTLMVCGALIIAGLLLKADVPRHHILHPQSFHDLMMAFAKGLAWPWSFFWPWMAPFNLLIFILLAWKYWRAPQGQTMAAERMILLAGLWAIMQTLAVAYSRGVGGASPVWRYMDTIGFLMVANWLGIVTVLSRQRQPFRRLPLCCAGITVWVVTCLAGLWSLSRLAVVGPIPSWNVRQEIRLENTLAFLATDNEHILDKEEPANLAFPYIPELAFLLRDKDIRRVLPACVREPLRVEPNGGGDGAFIANGVHLPAAGPAYEKCWGSFSGSGAQARGTFESAAIKAGTLPFLEIPVAGDLGEAGLDLELVEISSGNVIPVKIAQPPGERWMNAQVKAPAGEFKLVAHDDSATKWFAFKEPREMGRLSYWALCIVGAWKYCVAAGIFCLLGGTVGFLKACGNTSEDSGGQAKTVL